MYSNMSRSPEKIELAILRALYFFYVKSDTLPQSNVSTMQAAVKFFYNRVNRTTYTRSLYLQKGPVPPSEVPRKDTY